MAFPAQRIERTKMAIAIYGYPGCTTVKKARDWAESERLDPGYDHFSKLPDLRDKISDWVSAAGIDAVFNDRSQTFRKLDADRQREITASSEGKIAAMAEDPRLIKRPVVTDGVTVLTGFSEKEWSDAFL
jgi:Spx/MgsR family transcriptional regulator